MSYDPFTPFVYTAQNFPPVAFFVVQTFTAVFAGVVVVLLLTRGGLR